MTTFCISIITDCRCSFQRNYSTHAEFMKATIDPLEFEVVTKTSPKNFYFLESQANRLAMMMMMMMMKLPILQCAEKLES